MIRAGLRALRVGPVVWLCRWSPRGIPPSITPPRPILGGGRGVGGLVFPRCHTAWDWRLKIQECASPCGLLVVLLAWHEEQELPRCTLRGSSGWSSLPNTRRLLQPRATRFFLGSARAQIKCGTPETPRPLRQDARFRDESRPRRGNGVAQRWSGLGVSGRGSRVGSALDFGYFLVFFKKPRTWIYQYFKIQYLNAGLSPSLLHQPLLFFLRLQPNLLCLLTYMRGGRGGRDEKRARESQISSVTRDGLGFLFLRPFVPSGRGDAGLSEAIPHGVAARFIVEQLTQAPAHHP